MSRVIRRCVPRVIRRCVPRVIRRCVPHVGRGPYIFYKQTKIFPNFLLYGAFNFNHVHAKALRIMIFTEF